MMKRIGELKAELDRIKLKSECQAEGIDAFDKKLREAEAENARLKAECQARQAENSVLAVECDSIKAEVERLTSDIQMEKENEDRLVREWQKANNEVYGLKTQVAALIDDQTRLKAEVERLTELNSTLALRYDATKSMLDGCAKEIEEMEAEVERLTTIIGADAIDREHGMCCDASAQVERLTQQVNYWRIESDCNHGRWLRCLEDLEHLRASSFVTAVPSEQYERVIKAGDEMALNLTHIGWNICVEAWNAAKEGKQS